MKILHKPAAALNSRFSIYHLALSRCSVTGGTVHLGLWMSTFNHSLGDSADFKKVKMCLGCRRECSVGTVAPPRGGCSETFVHHTATTDCGRQKRQWAYQVFTGPGALNYLQMETTAVNEYGFLERIYFSSKDFFEREGKTDLGSLPK